MSTSQVRQNNRGDRRRFRGGDLIHYRRPRYRRRGLTPSDRWRGTVHSPEREPLPSIRRFRALVSGSRRLKQTAARSSADHLCST